MYYHTYRTDLSTCTGSYPASWVSTLQAHDAVLSVFDRDGEGSKGGLVAGRSYPLGGH